MGQALANAATFAPDPQRRTKIAAVHVAKKQLGLDDDDYRNIILRATGRTSAADCTGPELDRLVAEFRRLGFTSAARKPGAKGRPARADHPLARKARVMWISLAHLCAVREDPDAAIKADKGLEAFAKRQLKCTRFQWADQNQADKLVEALKSWADRHGWDQSQRGLAKALYVDALKLRLCDAILVKLKRAGIASPEWTLEQAAFRLCGVEPVGVRFTVQELEHLAAALGRKLRAHGGQGVFAEVTA